MRWTPWAGSRCHHHSASPQWRRKTTIKMTRRYRSMTHKLVVRTCADETRLCLKRMNKTEGRIESLTQLGLRMLSTAVIGVTLFWAAGSPTEAYPVRPIKVVVGFAPGGSIDGAMRLIA